MINDNIVFSIIVPLYNARDKVDKGLNSLENQTYKNFEIIFIDDCSKDNTYNYIKEYSKKSSMDIKIFKNKNNSGPGESRNNGIKKSNGEYLVFMDSDDYFEKDALEKLYLVIKKYSPDCICIDYNLVKNHISYKKSSATINCSGLVKVEEMLKNANGSVWSKIIKKEIIESNEIKFPVLNRNEDIAFVKIAISFCNSIYYLKENLYNYVMYDDSIMHKKIYIDENNSIKAYCYIKENLNKLYINNLENIFIKECLYSVIVNMITNKVKKKDIKRKVKQLTLDYPKWYKKTLKDDNYSLKTKVIFTLYVLNLYWGVRLILYIRNRLYR